MQKSVPQLIQVLLESPLSREPGSRSLQKQLYERIHAGICDGSIPSGSRLPGTRNLADSLNIARNTVIAVFEQLATEGMILSSTRGSTVSGPLGHKAHNSEDLLAVTPETESGYKLRSIADAALPFFSATPALNHFPFACWRRTEKKVLRSAIVSIPAKRTIHI